MYAYRKLQTLQGSMTEGSLRIAGLSRKLKDTMLIGLDNTMFA